ncbi:hypothetical protein ACTFIV_007885 [Dictyostelium citrinum]
MLLSRVSQWIKSPRTTKLQTEGPKSECISKEVQDLLVDDATEQVLPTQHSKLVFYSNVFTVPKPGTNLLRPVLDLKKLNNFLANQSFKMEGIKNLPSMVKQGYYMIKLDIKKAYLHVLVDPHYRDLLRFVWNGVHYRWKIMPFGLSTTPRIFTMLLRPVLRMLRELNVSVIAYLDDLLISVLEPTQSITFLGLQIDSTSMQLLVPKEKKKKVFKEIRNFLKLDSCTPRKLAGLKGKLIAQRCSHPIPIIHSKEQTSSIVILSNSDGSVCIPPQPSNDQLLHNQNECTPTRLESMEAVSSISTSNTFAFCPGEDQLIEFDEGFYNTDIPSVEISNMVSDDSKSSSSSSSSSVSSSSRYIPRIIVQRVNTYSDSTTMEVGDYSTFQSHVKSIINTQKLGTTELFMSSWQPSTLKVYDSNSSFFSFCMKNSLDPSDITLVVFMNYLTYLFNLKPPLAYSTINSHRSMLNQLLWFDGSRGH